MKEDIVWTYDRIIKSKMITSLKSGFVSNKDIAIKIGQIILCSVYGDKIVKQYMPYNASIHDGIWYISGTEKKGYEGGVPIIKIRKSDGAILGVIHHK